MIKAGTVGLLRFALEERTLTLFKPLDPAIPCLVPPGDFQLCEPVKHPFAFLFFVFLKITVVAPRTLVALEWLKGPDYL